MTSLEPHGKTFPGRLYLHFYPVCLRLAAASYLTYQNYEKQFRTQVESQLSAIAALKVDELQNWRAERLRGCQSLSSKPEFFRAGASISRKSGRRTSWEELLGLFGKFPPSLNMTASSCWMRRVSNRFPSRHPRPGAVPAALVEHAAASLASSEVIFLDFHRHAERETSIHLSWFPFSIRRTTSRWGCSSCGSTRIFISIPSSNAGPCPAPAPKPCSSAGRGSRSFT